MIATRAGSKAKALLPTGWFWRGEMGFGADIPVGILIEAEQACGFNQTSAQIQIR